MYLKAKPWNIKSNFSGFQKEAESTSSWPQAIHHLRELMTRRLSPAASCQPSVTSLALLLTQQAWQGSHSDLTQPPEAAMMKLQMFIHY